MTIVRDGSSLPMKKQFMQRAFFPYGSQVCNLVGVMRASDDVAEAETLQASTELRLAHERFCHVVGPRVGWYVEGLAALEAEHGPIQRDLADHLHAFSVSLMLDTMMVTVSE